MSERGVTDDMLMAYADGELTEAEAAAIEDAVSRNSDLAQRLETFRTTRLLAQQSFARVRSRAVPAGLVRAVLEHGAPATTVRSRPIIRVLPIAASIALLAGVTGYLLGGSGPGPAFTLETGDGMSRVLQTAASGEARSVGVGSSMTVTASYRLSDRYCRKFRLEKANRTYSAIACRGASGWQIDLAVLAGGGDSADYSPASSSFTQTVDAFLDGAEAGPPLDPRAEAKAIGGGWISGTGGADAAR